KVLLSEGVDSIFDTHPGVTLAQRGGGDPDVTDTTVSGCGRQSNLVQQGTTTNSNYVRVAIHVIQIDGTVNLRHVAPGTLGLLASGPDKWGTHQVQRRIVYGEISRDAGRHSRQCNGQRFVDYYEDFGGAITCKSIPQHQIHGIENRLSE